MFVTAVCVLFLKSYDGQRKTIFNGDHFSNYGNTNIPTCEIKIASSMRAMKIGLFSKRRNPGISQGLM